MDTLSGNERETVPNMDDETWTIRMIITDEMKKRPRVWKSDLEVLLDGRTDDIWKSDETGSKGRMLTLQQVPAMARWTGRRAGMSPPHQITTQKREDMK